MGVISEKLFLKNIIYNFFREIDIKGVMSENRFLKKKNFFTCNKKSFFFLRKVELRELTDY